MSNFARLAQSVSGLLLLAGFGLICAGLLHAAPDAAALLGGLLQTVGVILLASSRKDLSKGMLFGVMIASSVLGGAIIIWAFDHLVAPAREAAIAVGFTCLFASILAVTWRLQRKARPTQ